MLHNLLGIRLSDRINIGIIYDRTMARKAQFVARTLKFKYAEHIRDDKSKWNVILTSRVPH